MKTEPETCNYLKGYILLITYTYPQVLTTFDVTLRLTVSQSLCLGFEPTLGLVTRYYFLSVEAVIEVEVEVTLRLTVSQSLCLGFEPTLGLVTRYYFLSIEAVIEIEVEVTLQLTVSQ
jgi:Fe-S cluster assembly iron-binding protein IscA